MFRSTIITVLFSYRSNLPGFWMNEIAAAGPC